MTNYRGQLLFIYLLHGEQEVSFPSKSILKCKSPDSQPVFDDPTCQPYIRIGVDDAPNVIEKVVDVDEGQDKIGEEGTSDPKECEVIEVDATTPFERKPEKKTFEVWTHFTTTLFKGEKTNRCNHYYSFLSYSESGTTSHLKNHKCIKKQHHMKNQQMLQFVSSDTKTVEPVLVTRKYDHAEQRKATVVWILTKKKAF
ncbi:hypothetical protein LIER_02508 [Lithospermum erythrorhizon]|uniref:Uncharacterized protein n=1 Tax=Lithospermum erythrorhizon TaxID=34254 RepID=A0AAV3NPP4_LITER